MGLCCRDIFIGDAIVRVNDHTLSDISHDEALALLVEAGPEVSLTLKHYKVATPFLLKQFGRFGYYLYLCSFMPIYIVQIYPRVHTLLPNCLRQYPKLI